MLKYANFYFRDNFNLTTAKTTTTNHFLLTLACLPLSLLFSLFCCLCVGKIALRRAVNTAPPSCNGKRAPKG